MTLTGTGVTEVVLQPTSLELGIQVAGNKSNENQNEASLVNGSGETINVTVTPGTGPDQGDFLLSSISGLSSCATVGVLAPGGRCYLVVIFQPQAASGPDGRTGSYAVSWAGTAIAGVVPSPTPSPVVNVMGTGVTGIQLRTNTITGPNEYVGFTESGDGLEYVSNGTPNPITVTIPPLTGNNPGDFAVTLSTGCAPGGVIPAETYCPVDLSFTPSAIGLRTATVTFNYTGVSNGTLTASLSATGIPGPVFIEAPSIYGFSGGSEHVRFRQRKSSAQRRPEKMFLIRNAATTPLNVQSITKPGNGDFKITQDSTCSTSGTSFTLPGGSSCFIGMTFTPLFDRNYKESTSMVITDAYTSTNGTGRGLPAHSYLDRYRGTGGDHGFRH